MMPTDLDVYKLGRWVYDALFRPEVRRLAAAGVDREVRGWKKASDHAPVWIEIGDNRRQRGDQAPSRY